MTDKSVDKDVMDLMSSLSPAKKEEPEKAPAPDDTLDSILSSAEAPEPSPEKAAEKAVPDLLLPLDDPLFTTFKEIPIDAKPMNLNEVTPQSSMESEGTTPASTPEKPENPLNYTNFESALFRTDTISESLDATPASAAPTSDKPAEAPGVKANKKEEPTKVEDPNEFSRFYENLYTTEEHGPPVVGAFIVRTKDSKNEFLFSHPPELKVKSLGITEGLKAQYTTLSYTAKRDFTAELQSSLHLLPDLALGARKKDGLVDFVHFVLPSHTGNVFYGTSYVLQLSEDTKSPNAAPDPPEKSGDDPANSPSKNSASKVDKDSKSNSGGKAESGKPKFGNPSDKKDEKTVDLLGIGTYKATEPEKSDNPYKPKSDNPHSLDKAENPANSNGPNTTNTLEAVTLESVDKGKNTTTLETADSRDNKNTNSVEAADKGEKNPNTLDFLSFDTTPKSDPEKASELTSDSGRKPDSTSLDFMSFESTPKHSDSNKTEESDKTLTNQQLNAVDLVNFSFIENKEPASGAPEAAEAVTPKDGAKTPEKDLFSLINLDEEDGKLAADKVVDETVLDLSIPAGEPKTEMQDIDLGEPEEANVAEKKEEVIEINLHTITMAGLTGSESPKRDEKVDVDPMKVDKAREFPNPLTGKPVNPEPESKAQNGAELKQDATSALPGKVTLLYNQPEPAKSDSGTSAASSDSEIDLRPKKPQPENKSESGVQASAGGDGSGGEGSGAEAVKPPEPEVKMDYVAVCLVSKVPFFGLIGSRLEYVAQTYFETRNFDDHTLLLSFLEHINRSDKVEDWSYESLFFNLEYHFKPFTLCLSYRALLFLLKSVLTEQKIAIYSECAARTSTCILSLLTMIPCANSFNFNSKAFGSLWYNWKRFGFPLDLFRLENPIYPYFTESMIPLLSKKTGYLIGITDLDLIRKFRDPPALIFDLEDEAIKLRTKDLLGFYSPSFFEISFFNDFEIFDDVEMDDEPLRMVLDTSENIFHFVGDYLSKAPATIVDLGGKASKIYHMGRNLGARRYKESYLRLFDVYFPGALPKFLRFSKRATKQRKDHQPAAPQADADGEDDHVGKVADKKPKKLEPLDLKSQWERVMEPDNAAATPIDDEDEEEMDQPAFTFQVMFEKMRRRSTNYRYLGYISTLQSDFLYDRTKEIEYAIFTRIQPLRDFLLKFLKSVAYAGGKGRRSYQLVMDFTFDLDSMVDFNNPVDGVYIVRNGKYLRGYMQNLADLDEDEAQRAVDRQRKSYLMDGDEEVVVKVPSMLATFILELQNNHSVDLFELWIQTHNFNEFYKNHNLEVFNEPVFYLSHNLAKYTYPNGDFYVGELVDMLRDGKGSYVSKDGSRYDGSWKRDKRHGKGTLITDDCKYTGEWINDKKHGFGRLESHSYSYVGDFRLNKYHGNGTMLFKDGIKLKGEFKHGRFEGKGIMTLPDGSVRMGTFKNGVITGVCSVIDKEGRVYVGQLFGDLFHGKGVLKYNKQTSFEGFWVKGKRVKQGTIMSRVAGSVIKVESVWEDDNMLMNDVLVTFPNGYKYSGSLRYFPDALDLDKIKGESDFKTLDPRVSDEDLRDFAQQLNKLHNKLLPHGNGICKDTDGGVYNGLFFYGARHGRTSQVFPNGAIYSGNYYLGRFHGAAKVQLGSDVTLVVDYNKGKLGTQLSRANLEELTKAVNPDSSLFEEEFTKYKLDALVDVMKSNTLKAAPPLAGPIAVLEEPFMDIKPTRSF